MTITQKKASNKITFQFEEDCFQYTLEDKSAKISFSVDYDTFPVKHHTQEERQAYFRNVGVVWLVIAAFDMASRMLGSAPSFKFSILLFPGIAFLIYYRLSITPFLVFDSPCGRVFVIANKQAESILKEIHTRRIAQIRSRYARLIDASQPERESARFEALLRENIITQDEFDDLMIDLRLGISANTPLED